MRAYRRRVGASVFLSAVLVLLTLPAHADTDYRCLNLCVSQGGAASKCMPQCTYSMNKSATVIRSSSLLTTPSFGSAPPKTIDTTAGGALSNHRILPTQQLGDPAKIMSTVKPVNPISTTRNYQCIAQCTQAKLQYSTCESSCTTVTDKASQSVLSQPSAGSTGVIGILNNQANPPASAAATNPYAK